jgi:hypothetical protein
MLTAKCVKLNQQVYDILNEMEDETSLEGVQEKL